MTILRTYVGYSTTCIHNVHISQLQAILSYGHSLVPCCPDKRGSTVYDFIHFQSILSETSQHHHTQSLPERDHDITNIHCIRHLCNVRQPHP